MAQQLKERINEQRQELADSWNSWSNICNWVSWLLPLAGPLLMLFKTLLFGLCILNMLDSLVSSCLEAIKLQVMLQLAHSSYHYSPLDGEKP